MHNEENALDPRLEQELAALRAEEPDAAALEAIAARSWARISAEHARQSSRITSCADFQALMPACREGTLPEAKRLLLVDHTHECVACRRALHAGEFQKVLEFKPARRWFPSWSLPAMRWAAAAAVVVAIGLTSWTLWNRDAGSQVVLAAADGAVYQMLGEEMKTVAAGTEIPGGAAVRTGKGAWATVKLADGSQVEVRERTAFSVSASRKSLTVSLDQGNIIVQAAKRSSGNLFVATRDCKVAVTGTVFSVNSGVKGSRVAVVEGEVHVSKGDEKKVLRPGDLYASDASMAPVNVEQEIAWSRNVDRHVAVLKEMNALEKGLREIRSPELRYFSKLLDRLPERTVVYVSVPNLADAINQVEGILRERAAQSETMRQMLAGGKVEETLNHIRAVSEYLGDEIVVAGVLNEQGRMQAPVLLAEMKRDGLPEMVEQKYHAKLSVLDGRIAVLSPEGKPVAIESGFAGSPFYSRIQEIYRHGAGIVMAADLKAFCQSMPGGCKGEFTQFKDLVFEQKEIGGKGGARVTLGFDGPRRGVAAWLGAPSALRVLDYVTPDAGMVAAFSVVNAVSALEDLLARYPEAEKAMKEVETKTGVDVRKDLAAALGGEVMIAMDGPALPFPSWKLVAEVYDPVKLQWTIERFLDAYNRESGRKAELKRESLNGRLYYTIALSDVKFIEAHYTFANGYFIAAANRNLIDQAMKLRAAGLTLARSQKFQDMLPPDEQTGYSAVFYQNMSPTLSPLAEQFGAMLKPEQKQAIEGLAAELKPMLVAAYAVTDRITLNTSGGVLQLSLPNLGLGGMLSGRAHGTKGPKRPYR